MHSIWQCLPLSCVLRFVTRGQFWPSGIVVACVCLSVCPSVRVCGKHLLVRAISHHPFKLVSLNLDHRCKRPWWRSLLLWGGDWHWPSRSNLTSNSKFTPFWACVCHDSSPIEVTISKFRTKMHCSDPYQFWAWLKLIFNSILIFEPRPNLGFYVHHLHSLVRPASLQVGRI